MQVKSENEVAQSGPTLCDPRDCSPPGSSVHGILQAGMLQGVAFPFGTGSAEPGPLALQAHSLPSKPPGTPMLPCAVQGVPVAYLFYV